MLDAYVHQSVERGAGGPGPSLNVWTVELWAVDRIFDRVPAVLLIPILAVIDVVLESSICTSSQ